MLIKQTLDISGSLTQLEDGTSYLVGEQGIGSTDPNGITLCALCGGTQGGFGPFDVVELLVYNDALDSGEQNAVNTYLSEKYGIELS